MRDLTHVACAHTSDASGGERGGAGAREGRAQALTRRILNRLTLIAHNSLQRAVCLRIINHYTIST